MNHGMLLLRAARQRATPFQERHQIKSRTAIHQNFSIHSRYGVSSLSSSMSMLGLVSDGEIVLTVL